MSLVHKLLPFQGEEIPLRIVEDPQARRCELIHGAEGLTLRRSADPQPPLAVVRRWYIERAREIFGQRVAHWAALLNVRCERLTIRDQRTVWGSCTKGGRLSFNWRVVMAPPAVLDYLVIHELSHLLEMNHSQRFWAHVTKHCADWKIHRRWLRDNSRRLKSVVARAT
jgi:predicted metal-dependent hydrolase